MKSSEYEVETTGWNHGAFIKISLHVFFKCKKVPQEDDAGLENIKVVCAIWSYKQIESWVCILNINRLVALTQFVVLLHRISRHDRGAHERVLFWNLKIASFLYRRWASVASSENDLQCALGPFAAESEAQVWGFSGMSNWDENLLYMKNMLKRLHMSSGQRGPQDITLGAGNVTGERDSWTAWWHCNPERNMFVLFKQEFIKLWIRSISQSWCIWWVMNLVWNKK